MDYLFGYKISDSKYPQMKIIETPKFILRPATLKGAPDFFEYFSQEKVLRYLPFSTHKNILQTKIFIKSFFINNYKKGNIGLNNIDPNSKSSEIGICINPKYLGHNFATELTMITLITGFELLNLDKLIALTYTKNKYTPKSLENLGFKYINTFKIKPSGDTCHRFELTKNEYLKLKEYYLPTLIESFYI